MATGNEGDGAKFVIAVAGLFLMVTGVLFDLTSNAVVGVGLWVALSLLDICRALENRR